MTDFRYVLERPAIDLHQRHFEGSRGGIIYIGTWLWQGRSSDPCLVLLHGARPVRKGRTVPVIIPLAEAWRWAMHGDVGDPAHCAQSVQEWLTAGLLPGHPMASRDKLQVMSLINDLLPDLINMPPAPRREASRSVGEVYKTDMQTGEVEIREVKANV